MTDDMVFVIRTDFTSESFKKIAISQHWSMILYKDIQGYSFCKMFWNSFSLNESNDDINELKPHCSNNNKKTLNKFIIWNNGYCIIYSVYPGKNVHARKFARTVVAPNEDENSRSVWICYSVNLNYHITISAEMQYVLQDSKIFSDTKSQPNYFLIWYFWRAYALTYMYLLSNEKMPLKLSLHNYLLIFSYIFIRVESKLNNLFHIALIF